MHSINSLRSFRQRHLSGSHDALKRCLIFSALVLACFNAPQRAEAAIGIEIEYSAIRDSYEAVGNPAISYSSNSTSIRPVSDSSGDRGRKVSIYAASGALVSTNTFGSGGSGSGFTWENASTPAGSGNYRMVVDEGTAKATEYFFTISLPTYTIPRFVWANGLKAGDLIPHTALQWSLEGTMAATQLQLFVSRPELINGALSAVFEAQPFLPFETASYDLSSLQPGPKSFELSARGTLPADAASVTVSTPTTTLGDPLAGFSHEVVVSTLARVFNVTTLSQTGPQVLLSNLEHVYDGTPKSATATLHNAGTFDPQIIVLYNGSTAAPRKAGVYVVSARSTTADVTTVGTLSIGRRPLEIKPDDASRLVGEKNPTFPVTITGLVGKDNWKSRPRGVSFANDTSAPGIYPITASYRSEPFLENYEVSTVNGKLLVGAGRGTYLATLTRGGRVNGRLHLTIGNGVAITARISAPDLPKDLVLRGRGQIVSEETLEAALTARDSRVLTLTIADGQLFGSFGEDAVGGFISTGVAPIGDAAFTGALQTPTLQSGAGPEADGNFTLKVARGVATLRGTLGDGRPFTAAANLDDQGLLHLYARPYGAKAGAFFGGRLWLSDEGHEENYAEGILTLRLMKPPGAKETSYPEGFDLDYRAVVLPWVAPDSSQVYFVSYIPFATDLGANLETLPQAITVTRGKRVGPTTNGFSLSTKSDGSFTGRFSLTGSPNRVATFSGVLLNPDETSGSRGVGTYTVRNLGNTLRQTGNLRFE